MTHSRSNWDCRSCRFSQQFQHQFVSHSRVAGQHCNLIVPLRPYIQCHPHGTCILRIQLENRAEHSWCSVIAAAAAIAHRKKSAIDFRKILVSSIQIVKIHGPSLRSKPDDDIADELVTK